jgi:predicted MFS family arabinose efflux permease
MMFGIIIFEFGSLLCGVSTSMVMLIIARAIAGVGAGGLISMVMIVVGGILVNFLFSIFCFIIIIIII